MKAAPHLPIDYSGKLYMTVEVEAKFPGGDVALQKYVEENLKTDILKNSAPDGTYEVMLRLIVSTDGSVSDVSSLTKVGYGIEEEVIKIIKTGPGWIPDIQKGKQVNSFKKQQLNIIVKTK
jgi:protein TonB